MRTRLAPSPTGALHIGNARTFLLNWLDARAAGGTIVLRIDDLDGPRVKAGAEQQALEDLRWLGMDWDEPDAVLRQSERAEIYDAAAQQLFDAGIAYPCVCSRKEIEAAASAPHGAEGAPYPGTCRGRWATLEDATADSGRPAALRFQVDPMDVTFDDLLMGPQSFDPAADTGDFPIRRKDKTAAYQLATVVDDTASGVDLVVRGADLLPSTARQLLLLRALGLPEPEYLHLPLVVGPDGRRLAKRHGDTRVAELRERGWSAARVVGLLASTAGLVAEGESACASELVSLYDRDGLGSETVVFDPAALVNGPGGV